MKKRSEVTALKKRSEVKSSAAERTVPLPKIDETSGSVHCDACDEDVEVAKLIIAEGKEPECPNCGASIESLATPTKLSTDQGEPEDKLAPTKSINEQVFVDKHPDRKWCGECGTELTIIAKGSMAGVTFPCGHGAAERIDDPRKAKRVSPAASLQTRTYHEIDKRNTDDKVRARTDEKGRDNGNDITSPGAPSITIEGDRISVVWGKSQFPLAMMSNFTVGDFFVSKQLEPGADRVKAAREILADIEKIADEAFDRQRAWYEKKLGSLQ